MIFMKGGLSAIIEIMYAIDAFNYVEKQLFDRTSSFLHYFQFMEKTEPIIEQNEKIFDKRYSL